jgi:predicted N-formylglutamate amidohydrolase
MYTLFLSCEHASNEVPGLLQAALGTKTQLLRSHRAYDPGALEAARRIADAFTAPLISGKFTRLAVDLNRSEKNHLRFSRYSHQLDRADLAILEDNHYFPYRNAVEKSISQLIKKKARVLHLSIHSFTPVLRGVKRNADMGLLYDPSRAGERTIASGLKTEILRCTPDLKVRFNYPYKGVSDGMTTWLRKEFPSDLYTGLEIEFNQKLLRNSTGWDSCLRSFIEALGKVQGMEAMIIA